MWHRIHRNVFTHREPKCVTEDDVLICTCECEPGDGAGVRPGVHQQGRTRRCATPRFGPCGAACQNQKFSREAGAFYTLVPIRPRSRGGRRSLRTFAVLSPRPPLAFNPRPRRLSTPTDAFELHPDIARMERPSVRQVGREAHRTERPRPVHAPGADERAVRDRVHRRGVARGRVQGAEAAVRRGASSTLLLHDVVVL